MNKILSVIIVLGLLVIGVGVYSPKETSKDSSNIKVGSVTREGEYQATTTYSKLSAPTFNNVQTLISNNSGTLGSVIITGAVAGPMRFINATSSTDIASTTIATFPNSAAVGTYVFDAIVTRGLIVESLSNLLPTTTITFREN